MCREGEGVREGKKGGGEERRVRGTLRGGGEVGGHKRTGASLSSPALKKREGEANK